MSRRGWRTLALAAGAALLLAQPASTGAGALRPKVVWKPIPFGAKRRTETAAYSQRHYGVRDWRLRRPHVIVQHFTVTRTFASTYATFAANDPDVEYGERPGVCSHFVVDRDGTVYQLVTVATICRHTVGLNWTALGIEHVGASDAEVMGNARQRAASQRLTLWLMQRHGIQLRDVIGHAESLASPYYRERDPRFRCRTHGDFSHATMLAYRRQVARLATRYRVATGPRERPYRPRC